MYQKCTIQGTKECQLVTLKALPFNITRSLALQNSTKRRPRRFDTLSWEHRLCDIFNESNCSYTLLSNIESTSVSKKSNKVSSNSAISLSVAVLALKSPKRITYL